MLKKTGLAALVAVTCACGAGGPGPLAPSVTSTRPSSADGLTVSVTPSDSGLRTAASGGDEWITHPAELPPGKIGENNCTEAFRFALGGDPNFHPQDASDPRQSSCWEHAAGHQAFGDLLYRQQFQGVHLESAPLCDGGPGDLEGIRICRVGGRDQVTPCGTTGPGGCAGMAPCGFRVVCH